MEFLRRVAARLHASVTSHGWWSERGVSVVEYAMLVALIAIVALAAVTYLGQSTCGRLSQVPEEAFSQANPTSC